MRPHVGMELQGRYELVERIALGGMGEVWRATDLRSGRAVAAKILRPELTGDEIFLSRLRAEAANSRGLRHPNLAVVLDSGERDGSGWIIMELVQGRALSDILSEQGTMQAAEILPILAQVARALQVVHDAGVVHRDVKPSNILINREGLAKLTDFGISTGVHQRPLTATGMVMGTAQYLSPEQAMGHMATPAGDLYALGVIAYEALVGHRPFTGATQVDIAFAHVNQPVPPLPDATNPEVREIVMELLAKDPGARPRSAREVARRLDRIVIHLPKESWDPRGQLSWVATGRPSSPPRNDGAATTAPPSRPGARRRREATAGTHVPTRQIPAAWRTRSAVAARTRTEAALDEPVPRHSSGNGLLGLPTRISALIVLGLVAALVLIITIGTLATAHSAPGSGATSSVTSPKEAL
ncbi:MAG: serine/threonine-protein kinase [Actinomyces urogenitalis]|nr:serine/threonine-protein kinase [Actinomyces urogenitalis]